MDSDIFFGIICGIMLSIVVLYLLSGFICGVFCNYNSVGENNNRIIHCLNSNNNINDNNNDNNIIPIEIHEHIIIEIKEKIENDNKDNLPIAQLVK
jgi:hypothetical protein